MKQVRVFLVITILLYSLNLKAQTVFEMVCNGNVQQVDSLLNKVEIDTLSRNGSSFLHYAAYCNQEEIVPLLLGRKLNINGRNKYGNTPLFYAIQRRSTEITKQLLSAGAQVNILNEEGKTPLYEAVRSNNLEVFKLLLDSSADPALGVSPLHDAVMQKSIEMVSRLVELGVEVNPKNEFGNTPLYLAKREGHKEIENYLLQKGGEWTPLNRPEGAFLGQKWPDSVPVVFAKNFVSNENFVHSPAFSNDGKEMYYTVESWNYHGGTIFFTKLIDGYWSIPQPTSIDGDYREIDPFLSPDNSEMYYCSNRPLQEKDSVSSHSNLWMLKKEGQTWGQPIPLTSLSNSDYHDWFPTLSQNGNLYYSTGPNRSSNLYFAERTSQGFKPPQDLGNTVNSSYRDYDPLIAPDESYIIFCSNRPGGKGSVDLYISFRSASGEWQKPINMGGQINTSTIEFAPRLSPDGQFLFFNREGSIFWVSSDVIDGLRSN